MATSLNKLRLLPDIPWGEDIKTPGGPTINDGLKFHYYANILARAAIDTPEPFTIGVYGGWGSGKTSLMRMMMNIVSGENKTKANVAPIWFNAWRYEKEEHLVVPLLATIITDIKEHQENFTDTAKDVSKKIINAFRGIIYGFSVKGKIGLPGISEAEIALSGEDMVSRYEALSETATDRLVNQSLYFRSFSRLDEITKKKDSPKLVVFIDDLDRCFPDKAISLLESIKLVLNQHNISFVLGLSPKIIQVYLKFKYKEEYNVPETLYEDYLEKLVQLPFHLPETPETNENVDNYVRGLMGKEEIFGGIKPEEYEPLVPICGFACRNNPRAIVRFLNRLLVMTKAHEMKEKEKNEGEEKLNLSFVHFGITNALELKWPDILFYCQGNPPVLEEKTPLCEYLVQLLKEKNDHEIVMKLESAFEKELHKVKIVFRILADDKSLRLLFGSKPGIEWLEKPNYRTATIEKSKEFRQDIEVDTEGSEIMSAEDVRKMIHRNNYYCSGSVSWSNSEGKGIEHEYETKEDGKLVFDKTTNLLWQQSGSDQDTTFQKAQDYINNLNNEKYAGYGNWRLPTLEEAMSLMESEKKENNLYIDSIFNNTQKWIWTADKYSASSVWVVYFDIGSCNDDRMDYGYYVRAVCRGQ